MTTVAGLLESAEELLEERKVEFPDTSALWLLSHALGITDPDDLAEIGDHQVECGAERTFREFVARRERHEPYQYIVGSTDFRGVMMKIEHGVFVPRLQSERMCDEIETWAADRRRPAGGWKIADLGTGCGAVAVSLALGELEPRRVWAVDISRAALRLVADNAVTHEVTDRLQPLASNWLRAFRPRPCLDIITAVPPYLNPGDERYLSAESLEWEPLETFFGEPTGDDLLRFLADEAGRRLRKGGLLALQLDSDQVEVMEEYINGDPDHPLTIEWILQDEDEDEDAILAVCH